LREGLAEEKKRVSLSSIKLEEESKQPEFPEMKKVNTGGSEEPMVAAPEFEVIKEEKNEENKDQKDKEEEQKDPSEKEPLK